jgi:sugar O-acyltransferase (sialic acid O-acetyltransferase NeuD family)
MTSERVRVLGVGAGGHAKVVLEILAASGGYEVVGLLDKRPELAGATVLGVPVLGDDELLERQYHGGVRHAFIGLGGAADTRPRRRLYELVRSVGFEIVDAVHPAAVVSPSARLGAGVTIAATAVVGPDAELGDDVLVNTGATVDHDCRIGSHAHVAIGARLASGVRVGDGVHVGAGATVLQGVELGDGAVVGAGAVVREDVEPGVVAVGVPARVLRRVDGS